MAEVITARSEHIQAISRVRRAAAERIPTTISADERTAWLDGVANIDKIAGQVDREELSVLVENGQVTATVGLALLGPLGWMIYGLYCQRSSAGAGSLLLNTAIERAEAQGLSRYELTLDVIDSNAAAQAFFERRGWRVVGERSGRGVSALRLLRLQLTPDPILDPVIDLGPDGAARLCRLL